MTIYKRLELGAINVLLCVGHNGHRCRMNLKEHRGLIAPEALSQSGNQSSLGIVVRAADCRGVVTRW